MTRVNEGADDTCGVERVSDGHAAHLLGETVGEVVVDGLLHQDPTRTGATLAVQAVDHEDDGVERPFEVGIVEDDHRILAAQLEVHPLQGWAPWAWIIEPVTDSPTKAIALMSGCSVRALPADSPILSAI